MLMYLRARVPAGPRGVPGPPGTEGEVRGCTGRCCSGAGEARMGCLFPWYSESSTMKFSWVPGGRCAGG